MIRLFSKPILLLFSPLFAFARIDREVRPLGFSKDARFAYEWVDQACACIKEKCDGNFGETCEPRGFVIHHLTTDKSEKVLSESELKSKGIVLGQHQTMKFPLVMKGDSFEALTSCQKDPKDSNKDDHWDIYLKSKKNEAKRIGKLYMATGLGNDIKIESYIRSPYTEHIVVIIKAHKYHGDGEWSAPQYVYGADLKSGFSHVTKIESNDCALK